MKTVLFEDKYNVDISQFHSTKEVDEFLEKKLGRKLKVVKAHSIDDIVELQ